MWPFAGPVLNSDPSLTPAGQHLSTRPAFWERPREKPLRPQNALGLPPDRWVLMCALISSRKCAFATQDWTFVPNNTSPPPPSLWQTESCTLAHLLISWGGTLLFSVHWETIIQSERSSMTQDGWMVRKFGKSQTKSKNWWFPLLFFLVLKEKKVLFVWMATRYRFLYCTAVSLWFAACRLPFPGLFGDTRLQTRVFRLQKLN